MVLSKLLKFIEKLVADKWTGQIRINFHKGDIAKKMTTLVTEDLGMSVIGYIEKDG